MATPLNAAETAELLNDGLDATCDDRCAGAANLTAGEFRVLAAESLTPEEAADRVGCDTAWIRRAVEARRLYGFECDGVLRLPSYQFAAGGVLPGLSDVLLALPETLHPLAVHRFLTMALRQLSLGGEELSPLGWLRAAGDTNLLRQVAAEL
jgi:hypothetical protein